MDVESVIQLFEKLKLSKCKKKVSDIPLDVLVKTRDKLDDLYYNEGMSVITDEKYDIIKEYINDKKIGAKLREGDNRAKLPFWLGSADKVTPENPNEFKRWKEKNLADEYIASAKLDGVSCLLVYDGKETKLYTRGDGVVGADISYLKEYFNIPKLKEPIAIRGELIIKKHVYQEKYSEDYRNPRNMIAGLIGGKTSRAGLVDVNFVTYEIVDIGVNEGDFSFEPEQQLKKLKELGFKIVDNIKFDKKYLTIESLKRLLVKLKSDYKYQVDGVIIQPNKKYDRNTEGNPDYLLAFKMNMESFETIVRDVKWNVSRMGQLKPVVVFDPISTGDVIIKRATAHNAKYIVDNKIGVDSVIEVTRSKDVIPFIVSVVKSTSPLLPKNYIWDKTHTNILTAGNDTEHTDNICKKVITNFFAVLEVKHLSSETVSKMYDNGLNTVMKILTATEKRLMKVPGFGAKTVQRIYEGIHSTLSEVEEYKLLTASGIFGMGMGEKRIRLLLQHIPNLTDINGKKYGISKITKIEGFSDIMAKRVVDNLQNARLFIQAMSKHANIVKPKQIDNKQESLLGKKFVFTGFRDTALKDIIQNRGGNVTDSVSKNTTCVVIAKKGADGGTTKVLKAKALGLPVIAKDEFIELYKLGNKN